MTGRQESITPEQLAEMAEHVTALPPGSRIAVEGAARHMVGLVLVDELTELGKYESDPGWVSIIVPFPTCTECGKPRNWPLFDDAGMRLMCTEDHTEERREQDPDA